MLFYSENYFEIHLPVSQGIYLLVFKNIHGKMLNIVGPTKVFLSSRRYNKVDAPEEKKNITLKLEN